MLAMAYGSSLQNLVYVGMVGIFDPPRPGVRESIETVHGAGVHVKMVTGDSMETACAIGRQWSCINSILLISDEQNISSKRYFSVTFGSVFTRRKLPVGRSSGRNGYCRLRESYFSCFSLLSRCTEA